ncbi:hypothetical protein [Massilia sp. 9096]|uniref:hypothetical protein n=1 Tax=Massilia sp. 9096 TaxID=1500894 RepID=UPI000690D72D|nr:hypothetical protein [Massilia sp. 9096]
MLSTPTSRLRSQGFGLTQQPPEIYVLEVRRQQTGTAEPVVDWVLVEKVQAVERDLNTGTVQRAKLNIFYWDLSGGADQRDAPSGDFSASYEAIWNLLSLTSGSLDTGGYVLVEPVRLRGAHLGTYLMNLVVSWAKQWPGTDVREIRLLAGDAGNDNRLRRNRFYEQFGIKFDFDDASMSAGSSQPMKADNLVEVTAWKQSITEHNLVTYLRRSTNEAKMLSADRRFFQREFRAVSLALNDAYRRPVTWMWKRLIMDNLARTLLIGASVLIAGLCVYRLV